jgi:hypothetical protein
MKTGLPYFLLGAFLAFLLLRGCSEPEPGDTIYIRGKDSLRIDYVQIIKTVQVPHPVAVYRFRDRPEDHQPDPCDSVRVYRSRVDTLGVVLHITDSVQGVLLRQQIAGTWPRQYITRVDTIRQIIPGRAYRYSLGALTDGRDVTIEGGYAVTRQLEMRAAVNPKQREVRLGLGVRF